MDQLWGISGPAFLWLYIAGLALALAAAAAIRSAARRPPAPDPTPTLDELDLAFLAGGPNRVVETVIARLVHDGRLRTNRGGTLTATTTEPQPDPLEQLVLQRVGSSGAEVGSVVRGYAGSSAVRKIGDRLVANGLLVAPATAGRARRRAVRWLGPVLAVGILRWVVGLGERLAVGYLTVLLIGTVALIVVLWRTRVSPRTVHGERALAAAERSEPVMRVALAGLSAYPDAEIRTALVASAGIASVSGWAYGGSAGGYASCSNHGGDSGASSSSGGGDAGGSSCGGGGGGCGGGS